MLLSLGNILDSKTNVFRASYPREEVNSDSAITTITLSSTFSPKYVAA